MGVQTCRWWQNTHWPQKGGILFQALSPIDDQTEDICYPRLQKPRLEFPGIVTLRVSATFIQATFRGRPPILPFAREAAALAGDLACPARRASAFSIQRLVPKTPETNAGT